MLGWWLIWLIGVNSTGYILMLDAGSTGTRPYLFKKESKEYAPIHFKAMREISPGLSSQTKESAYSYLKALIIQASRVAFSNEQSITAMYVFGTGGMRYLSESEQNAIYQAIFDGAAADNDVNIPLQRSNLRTITGEEEGLFQALSINFLSASISRNLKPGVSELFGALDLGGSSTQIIFDVKERWKLRNLRHHRRIRLMKLDRDDFFTHSFLGYGTNRMHDSVIQYIKAKGDNQNPCLFKGDARSEVTGSGDAKECRQLIETIISRDNQACPETKFCALDSYAMPPVRGKFYAVSVFHYAAEFANDILAFAEKKSQHVPGFTMPNPTIQELEDAAEIVCGFRLSELERPGYEEPISRLTPNAKLPRRCFDLCYVSILLKRYGFSRTDRNVFFTDEIKQTEPSWTIGAYLSVMAEELERMEYDTALRAEQLYAEGLPKAWKAVWLTLFGAIGFLYYETRKTRHVKLKSFRFIDDASE